MSFAMPDTEHSPRIGSNEQAQAFIRDWFRRWAWSERTEEPIITFEQGVLSCAVKVDFGQTHPIFWYDLSRGETEASLHNCCLACVEPKMAWKAEQTRWKGKLNGTT